MKVALLKIEENILWNDVKKYVKYLSPKRREKCERYIDERKKIISLFTELLIRKEAGNGREVIFRYNKYGKPYLDEPKGIYFSVSHSNNYIAYVQDNEEIGIDIEYMEDFNKSIVDMFFSEKERKMIKECDNEECYRIWTKKEAYLKMRGTGFNKNSFSEDITGCREYKDIVSRVIENYMISVCSSKKVENLEIIGYNISDIILTN